MAEIKLEYDNVNVCAGCLSMDRFLAFPNNNLDIYLDLMGNQALIDNMKRFKFCWECMAMLKRIGCFQRQVRHAQVVMLENFFQGSANYNCLSKLAMVTKGDFDFNIQYKRSRKTNNSNKHTDKTVVPLEIEEKKSKEKQEIKTEFRINENYLMTKQEATDDSDGHFDDILETDEAVDIKHNVLDIEINQNLIDIRKELSNDKKLVNLNNKLFDSDNLNNINLVLNNTLLDSDKIYNRFNNSHLTVKKYLQYASVKEVNAIEFDSVPEYFEEIYLYEEEYDEILKRDTGVCYKFQCRHCDRKYKRELDLKRHTAIHHSKDTGPYRCAECKRSLESRSELVEHWKTHTKVMRCKLCLYCVRCKNGDMKKHLITHTALYTCLQCGQCFGQARAFGVHYYDTHVRVTCDYCQRKFKEKRKLQNHILRNHLPPYCSICKKSFTSYHRAENHSRTNHPHLFKTEVNREDRYCVECDKLFISTYKYKRHLKQSARHTPKPKLCVPCKVCGKTFTRTNYMNNHFRLFHTERSSHYCDICDKSFVTGYALRNHRKHVHEKHVMPRTKVCDICGRAFSTNKVLENHRRTHTGERPYKCSHCPAAFAQRSAMKTHQKSQHKNMMEIEAFLKNP